MYINPSTDIKLLHGVPLDNTYRHTVYYADALTQSQSLAAYTKYNLTDYTYQRVNRGIARVGIEADKLYDCNYMMYRNTAYGNKWFYAFITSVEYVNDGCTEIRFETDIMQTWLFDVEIPDEVFVDRQHVLTDTVGEWIQPENVDLGDYVVSNQSATNLFTDYSVLVSSADDDGTGGGYRGGIYTGLEYVSAPMTTDGITLLNEYLQAAVDANRVDQIVSLLFIPTAAIPDDETAKVYTATFARSKYTQDIGGYTPRNNKLFTYPYNFLYVQNGVGGSTYYKLERFNTSTDMTFKVGCCVSGQCEIVLYANDYSGESVDFENALCISGFPQCAFTIDTYRAWLAQGGGVTTALSLVSNAASIATGNVAGGALGAANTVAGAVLAANQPNTTRGIQSNSVGAILKTCDYIFSQKHILPQYAVLIDDYFDRYGYSHNKFAKLHRTGRPHWNYVKTRDVTLRGSVPADDLSAICNIYDHGITFWKNISEVGDYTLDNRLGR